jgi:dienelactone hydrolase
MRLTRRDALGLAGGAALGAATGQAVPGPEAFGGGHASGPVVRRAVSFPSDGETLRGWLYLPPALAGGARRPGIVTANALTSVKEINLPDYAERFAAAGYPTVVFDYRYWGASTGSPRFHVAPAEHRADIRHALTFLAAQPGVDPRRLGGFGISMGGGHMLSLAAWEPRLRAVAVASTGIDPPRARAPLSPAAARARYDQLAAAAEVERRGRAAAHITTLEAWCPVPRPGCVLPVKEAYDYYERARRTFAPRFENRLTSTSFANLLADDVTFGIHLAHAPILIVQPDRDVVPVEHVLFWFKRAPEPKRLVVLGGLHTTTYTGGRHLETAAAEAVAWFRRYL